MESEMPPKHEAMRLYWQSLFGEDIIEGTFLDPARGQRKRTPTGKIAKIERPCEAPGCDRKRDTKRYCMMHHNRWKRNGHLGLKTAPRQPGRTCDECGEKHYAKGLCLKHYNRKRYHEAA